MNRKLFTSVIIKDEGVRLDYYLLQETVTGEDGNHHNTYGVEIRQTPLDTFSGCPYLMSSVPDITCCQKEMELFLQELAQTATDPSCLENIVEDYIE